MKKSKKSMIPCAVMLLAFCLCLSGCQTVGRAQDASLAGEAVTLSQTGIGKAADKAEKETAESGIRADFENRREARSAELLEEKEKDTVFTAVPQDYEAFDELTQQLKEAIEKGDEALTAELDEAIEAMDRDGALAAYQVKRYRAEEDYGAYAYYESASSPYEPGMEALESGNFPTYESLFDQSAITKWPRSYLNVLGSDVCFAAEPIGTATKEIAVKEVYTQEQMEKEGYAEDAVITDFAILMRVTECYWGGLACGDVVAFAPRTLSAELAARMEAGEGWLIFASFDGTTVEAEGKQYNTLSTGTEGVYLVASEEIYPASPYKDLQQYRGMSPWNLSKKGLGYGQNTVTAHLAPTHKGLLSFRECSLKAEKVNRAP